MQKLGLKMADGAKPGTGQTGARLGWFVVTLVWLVFGALILWGSGGLFDYLNAQKQVRALEAQAKALEEETAALEAEIKLLQENPEIYEPYARERLFMKKPGEVILYLPPDSPTANAPNPAATTPLATPILPP